jgi:hypothetical protein
MSDRRAFLRNSAAMAAALTLTPKILAQLAGTPASLPARTLFEQDSEAYWTELRKQFLIPEDEVYLNNGTVGSSPRPVLEAIFRGYEETEKMAQADPEDYPIWG